MSSLVGALLDRVPRRTPTVTDRASLPFAIPNNGYSAFQQRGAGAYNRIMENVGTVYAIVSKTAEAAASVEWRLYRKSTDSRRRYAHDGMNDRREVTQHLALKVWDNPNPHMTRQYIVESYTQHMMLTGEGWWFLATVTPTAPPAEIWPISPARIEVVEDPELYIAGYTYNSPGGQRIQLEPREVIYSRRPNPYSEYRGIGPVQAVLLKADAIRYSDEWNRSLFLNNAEPGGVLKVNADLSDREIARLRARWDEAHSGPANAGRVAILDAEDAEWVPAPYTQRDMQFAELQQLNSEQIREAFAFQKFMLGTTEDANRASAETSENSFYQWTVVPVLERIKQALNTRFLPLFGAAGEGVEFDYVSPVRADQEMENASLIAKSTAATALIGAGFYAPEVREALGLPEFSYGEPKDEPGVVQAILNAQRWEARATLDDNTCDPCRENNGKTYKNREQAYKDYPGGSSYVKCVGEKYGNECRCTVIKRGKSNDVTEEVNDG